MALCLLVLVFSFAAKLAWYQPKNVEMHSLSSSKMWQYELKAASAVMSAPEDSGSATAQTTALLAAALLMAVATRWKIDSSATGEWLEREIAFAFRQAQFARITQFRAPPVR